MGILDRFFGKEKVETPSIEVKISGDQTTTEYFPYSVQKLPNGDYMINPGASFELTLGNSQIIIYPNGIIFQGFSGH